MAFYTDDSDSQPFAPKSGETNRAYNTSYISTYSRSYEIFNPDGGTFNTPEATVASTGWSNVLNTLAAQQLYTDTFRLHEQKTTADMDVILLDMIAEQSQQMTRGNLVHEQVLPLIFLAY